MQVVLYDGSFEGLLTAVFEIYEYKITSPHIVKDGATENSFFAAPHYVQTDIIKCERVFKKLKQKLTPNAFAQLYKTYLSELKEIENYISRRSGKDFSKVFDQYLRSTKIPVLEYKIIGNKLSYRWNNTVAGFAMPVKLAEGNQWLKPSSDFKTINVTPGVKKTGLMVDKNFYIIVKKL